ncbi:MAG: ABC transporter permease [Coriobacteriia bacterium]|nr:ABC transporter permease [Coriobacteriia bacterium]
MNKIFKLAKANIRKNKGQAASLLILVLIATLLLNTGLVLFIGVGEFFDKRADELNAAHALILQDSAITTSEQMRYLKNYPGVTEYERHEVIADQGDYFLNGVKAPAIIVFSNAADKQNMNPPSFIGEFKPLTNTSVYVPYLMKVAGGYELGDDYQINLAGKEMHFTIAGFTEEIHFGSLMNNIYRFYVSDATYKRFIEEFPAQQRYLQAVRMTESSAGTQLILDYAKKFIYSEDTNENTALFAFSLSHDSTKTPRTLISTIMAMVVVAFAVILLIISLVVIRFRIVNSIEEEMTNIGALKATGYLSSQIISSLVLQFASLAVVGGILGLAVSQLTLPVVAGILETQSALTWKPGFDLGLAALSFLAAVLCVILVTFVVALRIRKLHPLMALRYGLTTHSFKKNSMPLDRARGPLSFLLALKQLLQGKKQALAILIIIFVVSFASIACMDIYYNIGVENDAFVSVIAGEKPDAGAMLKDREDTAGVIKRLAARPEVRKVFEYEALSVLADGNGVSAFITRDFSQLEGTLLYSGRYPRHDNEVALGGRFSQIVGIGIGEYITIKLGNTTKDFLVTGTIQMMENLGMNLVMTYDGIRTLQDDFKFSQIYIYLVDGTDVPAFIKGLKAREGDIFSSTVDMQELVEAQFSQFGTIFGAVAAGVLAITAVVIILVLYMIIKAMILRRRRELGIQKAVGFTTAQLMSQIALHFTPIVLVGVALGGVAGHFGFNPLFTATMRSSGIMGTDMPAPLLWTIVTCLALVALAYLVSMLIAWRIRKISPCALVRE